MHEDDVWEVCVCSSYMYHIVQIDLCVYNGTLLSHWKEWNNAMCSNMDALRDDHTKWSKPDKERQILYDITYM